MWLKLQCIGIGTITVLTLGLCLALVVSGCGVKDRVSTGLAGTAVVQIETKDLVCGVAQYGGRERGSRGSISISCLRKETKPPVGPIGKMSMRDCGVGRGNEPCKHGASLTPEGVKCTE